MNLAMRILQPEASEEEVRLFIKSTDLLDEQGERNKVSAGATSERDGKS